MKHGQNGRRPRSRGGKRPSNARSVFDSNGPDVKVRGTAQQIMDKYLTLARDAQGSGDRVLAESYLQFAEHYFRVLSADQGNAQQQGGQQAASAAPDVPDAPEGATADGEAKGEEKAEAESKDSGEDDQPTEGRRRRGRPARQPRATASA